MEASDAASQLCTKLWISCCSCLETLTQHSFNLQTSKPKPTSTISDSLTWITHRNHLHQELHHIIPHSYSYSCIRPFLCHELVINTTPPSSISTHAWLADKVLPTIFSLLHLHPPTHTHFHCWLHHRFCTELPWHSSSKFIIHQDKVEWTHMHLIYPYVGLTLYTFKPHTVEVVTLMTRTTCSLSLLLSTCPVTMHHTVCDCRWRRSMHLYPMDWLLRAWLMSLTTHSQIHKYLDSDTVFVVVYTTILNLK